MKTWVLQQLQNKLGREKSAQSQQWGDRVVDGLKFLISCLCLPEFRITSTSHHFWFMWYWRLTRPPQLHAYQAGIPPTAGFHTRLIPFYFPTLGTASMVGTKILGSCSRSMVWGSNSLYTRNEVPAEIIQRCVKQRGRSSLVLNCPSATESHSSDRRRSNHSF